MDIAQELSVPVEDAAKRLLGAILIRRLHGKTLRARIVETEAYDQFDAASHSFKGKTPRTEVMFGPAGHLYVYFTYGMHFCCNIVTGSEGEGAAVLIRAVEIIEGEEFSPRTNSGRDKTNGPAKLCQALGIDLALNGHDLNNVPLQLLLNSPLPDSKITTTTRIGIQKEKSALRRYYCAHSMFVSKK